MIRRVHRDLAIDALGTSSVAVLTVFAFDILTLLSRTSASAYVLGKSYATPDVVRVVGDMLGASQLLACRMGLLAAVACLGLVVAFWLRARASHGWGSMVFAAACVAAVATVRIVVDEVSGYMPIMTGGVSLAVLVCLAAMAAMVVADGWSVRDRTT